MQYLGAISKNNRMISVRFQDKPFIITVIQVYAPTSHAEEDEVERFYEDLQDLLELTPKIHIQFSSVAQSRPTLCHPMNRSMPGLPVPHHLPEFTQTHIHRVSNAISSSVIPFSSCPQSVSASVFSNESTLRMRWPKYWSFNFSIIPSKEIPHYWIPN